MKKREREALHLKAQLRKIPNLRFIQAHAVTHDGRMITVVVEKEKSPRK